MKYIVLFKKRVCKEKHILPRELFVVRVGGCPMLTFRMYATIKFNRAIDKQKNFISPGGYCMTMNGKDIEFDFEDYEGSVSKNDDHMLEIMQKNPDYDCFADLENITEEDLKKVTNIGEFYIDIENEDDEESALVPIEIQELSFVLPYNNWEEIHVSKGVLKVLNISFQEKIV